MKVLIYRGLIWNFIIHAGGMYLIGFGRLEFLRRFCWPGFPFLWEKMYNIVFDVLLFC